MQTTDGYWLPLDDVLEFIGVTAAEGSVERRNVDRARLAATAQIERVRCDLLSSATTGDTGYGEGGYGEAEYGYGAVTFAADPDIVEAGLLLAARLHARRNSPTGVASYGEFGPAAVSRFDPDIERLLGVGRYASAVVG